LQGLGRPKRSPQDQSPLGNTAATHDILLHYHRIYPTTWVYVSSLLMIGLFFKFNRFWSVRNLDILLLVLLAPGLLLVNFGQAMQRPEVTHIAAAEQDDPLRQLANERAKKEARRAQRDLSSIDGSVATIERQSGGPSSSGSPFLSALPPENENESPDAAAPPTDGGAGREDQSFAAESSAAKPPATEPPALPTTTQDVQTGRALALTGFIWLFVVGGILLLRMLFDPTMVRRPLLAPNLNSEGMVFIGVSLFVFLMANVITSTPTADDLKAPASADQVIAGDVPADGGVSKHGPGYWMLTMLPGIPTSWVVSSSEEPELYLVVTAKVMAILGHFAVVLGMILIGHWHFDNAKMGIAAAMIYLLLPYTAQMTGRVDHVLPAALLVWAVAFYRRPLAAGMFLGLASGVVYYPIFLLPLWISFYWPRGLSRFISGVAAMWAVLIIALAATSGGNLTLFLERLQQMFGLWPPKTEDLTGIWEYIPPVFRIPILAAFMSLSISFALWPAQKNLGTLLSCSAAVMLATQFWHGHGDGGGLYMAWYLPLFLLTILRPNLEDRVAIAVLGEGWLPRRRARLRMVDQAA